MDNDILLEFGLAIGEDWYEDEYGVYYTYQSKDLAGNPTISKNYLEDNELKIIAFNWLENNQFSCGFGTTEYYAHDNMKYETRVFAKSLLEAIIELAIELYDQKKI